MAAVVIDFKGPVQSAYLASCTLLIEYKYCLLWPSKWSRWETRVVKFSGTCPPQSIEVSAKPNHKNLSRVFDSWTVGKLLGLSSSCSLRSMCSYINLSGWYPDCTRHLQQMFLSHRHVSLLDRTKQLMCLGVPMLGGYMQVRPPKPLHNPTTCQSVCCRHIEFPQGPNYL